MQACDQYTAQADTMGALGLKMQPIILLFQQLHRVQYHRRVAFDQNRCCGHHSHSGQHLRAGHVQIRRGAAFGQKVLQAHARLPIHTKIGAARKCKRKRPPPMPDTGHAAELSDHASSCDHPPTACYGLRHFWAQTIIKAPVNRQALASIAADRPDVLRRVSPVT